MPSASAIELTSINIKNIGAIYFIIAINIFLDLNFSPFRVTSSIIVCGLMINPTNIQVNNAQIGINTLLLIKSIMSRIDLSIHEMNESGPKPKLDGIPRSSENAKTTPHAICLLHLNLSRKIETIVSISEIADVKAAKNTRTKKTVPTTEPIFMLLKTLGNVTNINPGPWESAAWSPPEKANTAGIIINPARKAIAVSKISICLTELSRLSFFFI